MKILFTGCCSGFGKTVREKLIDDGHKVFGVGKGGPDLKLDFSEIGSCALSTEAKGLVGDFRPDALVFNSGMTRIKPVETHDVPQFSEVCHVNLNAAYAFNRQMLKFKPDARIVNVSSMGIFTGLRHSPGYVASKAGLEALSRSLSREFAGRGAVISTVCPATVENTAMHEQVLHSLEKNRNWSREEAEKYVCPYPIGRLVTHEEMYEVISWALTKMPAFMTGTTLTMPGGLGI